MLDQTSMPPGGEARLTYNSADYTVRVPGSFVRCAVTGQPIPLDELKYWSFERQEPYVDAHASLEAEKRAAES